MSTYPTKLERLAQDLADLPYADMRLLAESLCDIVEDEAGAKIATEEMAQSLHRWVVAEIESYRDRRATAGEGKT